MRRVLRLLSRLARREEGQDLLEYGLLMVLIAVAALAGLNSVGTVINTVLCIRRVPNKLTLGIAALGVLIAVTNTGAVSVGAAFAGLGLGLAIMLPSHIIGATGAGDVKLFAALGTLLGPWGIVTAFVYTAIAGGVLALAVALSGRAAPTSPRSRVPRRITGSHMRRPSPSGRSWPRWGSNT